MMTINSQSKPLSIPKKFLNKQLIIWICRLMTLLHSRSPIINPNHHLAHLSLPDLMLHPLPKNKVDNKNKRESRYSMMLTNWLIYLKCNINPYDS